MSVLAAKRKRDGFECLINGTGLNGMKLMCAGVAMDTVVLSRLVQQAVLFGSAFPTAGFHAIRAIGQLVARNPAFERGQEHCGCRIRRPRS